MLPLKKVDRVALWIAILIAVIVLAISFGAKGATEETRQQKNWLAGDPLSSRQGLTASYQQADYL